MASKSLKRGAFIAVSIVTLLYTLATAAYVSAASLINGPSPSVLNV